MKYGFIKVASAIPAVKVGGCHFQYPADRGTDSAG